ncbi:glycosyltransferase [Butyrivibrio sp. VCD2006]|uniref:glycosyltransferase n=1 Tax=Butyrivibrio sp. VCD2006 TaxID=1280664 RepID=UPI000403F4E9|nr:glycosyltransferase [Butyrivibrio sp. VCD2006]
MNEIVSVIVPVYKVEKYLRKCVDSILNQSYRELDIILVNDGSPDDCGAICDEYAEKDYRVRVIHKSNGGLSSARNAALDVIKGSWVICVDSDDYVHHDMIKRLYEAAIDASAQISICSHYEEKGEKLLIADRVVDEIRVFDKHTALKKLIEDDDIRSYAWGKLYRAELFDGVRYPDGRNYEDVATTYYLFDKAEKIVKIPDYLYYYLQRTDGISFNKSTASWHKGCHATCLGQEERTEYFRLKGYSDLYEFSMAKLLPYLFSDIRSGYKASALSDVQDTKKYLKEHENEFLSNQKVLQKDKSLISVYLKDERFYKLYVNSKNVFKKGMRGIRVAKARIRQKKQGFDFMLDNGKKRRIVCFELPCFDNLGDHAIAFVTAYLLRTMCEGDSDFQPFIVDGWDTNRAILALKKCIQPDDVIICQGGGNFGNLYEFAEVFRRKVLRTFKDNRIIIMPQTVYYSDDSDGRKELQADKKAIKDCRNITILARDARSYELMKKYFDCTILQLHDVVSMYDASYLSAEKREGIVVCLRSDKESALSSQDKLQIMEDCEKYSEKVFVTDTCIHYSIEPKERKNAIEKKLSVFGNARLVVTDRLHGMIFALITKTPCIVMGNNHHKVYATYKTFCECEYIRYINDVKELNNLISLMLNSNITKDKLDMSDDIVVLTESILSKK